MAEGHGVIDANFDAFIAQMRKDGARDVLKIRIDDQPNVADAAALRVAQQRQRGDGDAVVVCEKVDGSDLFLGLLDDVDARLGSVAVIVENAENVRMRRRGEGDCQEKRGGSHGPPHCTR